MRDIRIGAAQFEHRDGDKKYNLSRIRAIRQDGGAAGVGDLAGMADGAKVNAAVIPGICFLEPKAVPHHPL